MKGESSRFAIYATMDGTPPAATIAALPPRCSAPSSSVSPRSSGRPDGFLAPAANSPSSPMATRACSSERVSALCRKLCTCERAANVSDPRKSSVPASIDSRSGVQRRTAPFLFFGRKEATFLASTSQSLPHARGNFLAARFKTARSALSPRTSATLPSTPSSEHISRRERHASAWTLSLLRWSRMARATVDIPPAETAAMRTSWPPTWQRLARRAHPSACTRSDPGARSARMRTKSGRAPATATPRAAAVAGQDSESLPVCSRRAPSARSSAGVSAAPARRTSIDSIADRNMPSKEGSASSATFLSDF
mmetsp:Transcript_12405/g.36538  ORF Transcript_12405/g.36538 Transcript_12405/m.36538 type:complete len:309 (+) Transcript_12405:2561-3487(+)